MSLYDFRKSCELVHSDASFNALLMAAMRKAGSNADGIRLQQRFPQVWQELCLRDASLDGLLPEEREATKP